MARKFVCAGNKNDEVEDFPGTRNDKSPFEALLGRTREDGPARSSSGDRRLGPRFSRI